MAFPWGALLTTTLVFLVAFSLPNVHAAENNTNKYNKIGQLRKHRPAFAPTGWKKAQATFYDGDSKSFGGACGYDDVVKEGYGLDTIAVSSVLFKDGLSCGSCYEIKCTDSSKGCKTRKSPVLVTATNACHGCSSEHLDLAKPAFVKIAEQKAGMVPILYRRVGCKKKGGIRFTITGNPHFNIVSVGNVGGAGDVTQVQVKGDKKIKHWTNLKRSWGQKWQTDVMLQGETLSFKVRTGDGRHSISPKVAPSGWKFGQTFEGKNFVN
ncbi:expansin-A9-like [Vigna radiata var. radiata]|uniref:Expansin n=1 Tax=Vigna radiata var. radiata TaxID=3916 RepID=A0A1S3TML7_VIGRR|nr:expansin-A9-like [Vigna radiata var. radiata]